MIMFAGLDTDAMYVIKQFKLKGVEHSESKKALWENTTELFLHTYKIFFLKKN